MESFIAEYGSKLRCDLQNAINGVTPDVFKIPPKTNTENIAAKVCRACSNTLMHILFCENCSKIRDGRAGKLQKIADFTRNDPSLIVLRGHLALRYWSKTLTGLWHKFHILQPLCIAFCKRIFSEQYNLYPWGSVGVVGARWSSGIIAANGALGPQFVSRIPCSDLGQVVTLSLSVA